MLDPPGRSRARPTVRGLITVANSPLGSDSRDDGRSWQAAAAGAAFSCLSLQVTLLTPIYVLSNQPELYSTDVVFVLGRGAAVSAVVAFVAFAANFALPIAVARQVLRGALLVVVLIAAEHSFLFYLSPFDELDGTPIRSQDMTRAALDLGILGVLAWLLVFFFRKRTAKTLVFVPLVILLMSAAQAAPKAIENWSRITPELQPPYATFFEFSRGRNLFFYLADTISLDAAQAVFIENPDLARQFEGFLFYTDTLSAQTTASATYAMLTGRILKLSRDRDSARYRTDIAAEGFPRHLSDAGYVLDYVPASGDHCVGIYNLCAVRNVTGPRSKSLLRVDYESYHDYLLLVDVSLFRHAPLFARRFIYNEGSWTISDLFGSGIGPIGIGLVLKEVIDNVKLVDGGPRFKWYHSVGAHRPWRYAGDCTRSRAAGSIEAYKAQILCVLREYVAFMQMLKERGLYDSTVLFFVSDHGIGGRLSNGANFPEDDPAIPRSTHSIPWAQHRELTEMAADRSRPMIMIKPFDRRGDLEFSRSQIHQINLPATVLSLVGIDSPYAEPSIMEIQEGDDRDRKLLRQLNRGMRNAVVDYDEYIVTGPSNDYESYRKVVSESTSSRDR